MTSSRPLSPMAALALALSLSLPAATTAQEPLVAALAAEARAGRRDPAAHKALGEALLRAGRFREARAAFRRAAALQRGSLEAAYDVARASFAAGDSRAAQADCGPLRRIARDRALTHTCLARAWLVWNRTARAFTELELALAADPRNAEALLALGEAHLLRAELDRARAALERAAEAAPGRPEPHAALARLHLAAERRADAIAELGRAVERDPASPALAYELGVLLLADAEGLALLRRAVEGRPRWAEARAALGEATLAANDADGALGHFDAALAQDAGLAAAHAGRGVALIRLNRFEEAEASLRRALELVPNSQAAALALADLFATTGRNEEALEQYRVAADMNPTDPTPLVRAARLAVRLGRDVLGAAFLDRLLDRHPTSAAGLALYGEVMRLRNDAAAARRYFEQALRGSGDFDRAEVERALGALGPARPTGVRR